MVIGLLLFFFLNRSTVRSFVDSAHLDEMELLSLSSLLLFLVFTFESCYGSPYNELLTSYNLNTNQTATSPLFYHTTRSNSTYTPSPDNWRSLPIYTVLLDKLSNGDPTNDDFFGTPFESDPGSPGSSGGGTQLRFGGDIKGLGDDRVLDYLQGMGVGVIYVAGTGFLNEVWEADGYSPLDFSVLDPHWGTWGDWVEVVDRIHERGMYFMADFTVGTMSDLIGFKGFLNTTAPFNLGEYPGEYIHPDYIPWNFTEYKDFQIINTRNTSCLLPQFWNDDGTLLTNLSSSTPGCLESDFDQYGSIEAFGVFPDWQRQLSKFAGVQDRLREWKPGMVDRLMRFSCMVIEALDIDAIRVDKALQVTVDALAGWSRGTRGCAEGVGKGNFYIAGEVTGGDTFGALYIGRGRTPSMRPPSIAVAGNLTGGEDEYFLRGKGENALDGCMDGNLLDAYDLSSDSFVTAWNEMFVNDDFVNLNSGKVDPRHMYGTSNFDVFRWPSLSDGVRRGGLGSFVTALVMPGLVMYYYGEEQEFYVFDSTASNYLYGRQAMTASLAWKFHGCYHLGSQQYFNMPLSKALLGCDDPTVGLDHFDPTTPTRLLFARFNELRGRYESLRDGFGITEYGSWTEVIERPGSGGVGTEVGLWSIVRGGMDGVQVINETVWMFMTNENVTKDYSFDCSSTEWIKSPYPVLNTTLVQNLLSPYETYPLIPSLSPYFNDGNAPYFGCLENITMDPYGFKVLVLQGDWEPPKPVITGFWPGHDARVVSVGEVALGFSEVMDCGSVTESVQLQGGVEGVSCEEVDGESGGILSGVPKTMWIWNATLVNIKDGILDISVTNPKSAGGIGTGTTDHFLLRKGEVGNVMVFPESDYDSEQGLVGVGEGRYEYRNRAVGADMLRYSLDFGISWSEWREWENVTVIDVGDERDRGVEWFWEGVHVMVQYWSQSTLSSATIVHADSTDYTGPPRRLPGLLARGEFNEWGNNLGVNSRFTLVPHPSLGTVWELELMTTWPSFIQLSPFTSSPPSSSLATSYTYGDTDSDSTLDRLPPNSESPNYLNMSQPPYPFLGYSILVDDRTMKWALVPRGRAGVSLGVYVVLGVVPLVTGALAVVVFVGCFYGVVENKVGVRRRIRKGYGLDLGMGMGKKEKKTRTLRKVRTRKVIGWPESPTKPHRTVLIATLEYEILPFAQVKVKIGGLGVMASLMGKSMTDVSLIWVVPKVSGVVYPTNLGYPMEPIEVGLFGETYLVEVEVYVYQHITYLLLSSPVFLAQSKSDPYPERMDDLSSAIFYSTWNQAIAEVIRRFPQVDVYHVNDYHGALAPLYLLPKIIPICLSLHNAEFQGLWPLRTPTEMREVCAAFNLSEEVCVKYVQLGNTFNLLHAAAEYIGKHQRGVGCAGVSEKYGKRSWARYPALWTLGGVEALANPDPSDLGEGEAELVVDEDSEKARPEMKRKTQEWAGIEQNPESNLFVFVGRWSKQKGVDLIADVMPGLLEKDESVQVITIGPIIDLYGRLAAIKLAHLQHLYPSRVYSKPEFTSLPPYLFSGADFALIPSRDEPFGLVAVEFGRKGALGVGSRLGGLGLMPGWWYPVESTSTAHLISQLRKSIRMALGSGEGERKRMRARSAVQRFPVVEWRQRMEEFHRRSVSVSREEAGENAWRESDGWGFYELGDEGEVGEVDDRGGGRGKGEERVQRTNEPLVLYNESPPPFNSPLDTDDEEEDEDEDEDEDDHEDNEHQHVDPDPDPDNTSSTRVNTPQTQAQTQDDEFSPNPGLNQTLSSLSQTFLSPSEDYVNFLERVNRLVARDRRRVPDPFLIGGEREEGGGGGGGGSGSGRPGLGGHSRTPSSESIVSLVETKSDSPLNKAIASFTDTSGHLTSQYTTLLHHLTPSNSERELSIEKYLMKSEREFFREVRKERLSWAGESLKEKSESRRSSSSSFFWASNDSLSGKSSSRPATPTPFGYHQPQNQAQAQAQKTMLNEGISMNRVQIALSREVKGWPLYTLLIALGQVLSATSFQTTLLTGTNTQSTPQLYILTSTFLLSSLFVWYPLSRLKPARFTLALPWVLFALAFLFVGLPEIGGAGSLLRGNHKVLAGIATGCYASASSAGFAFFALNFGEEAGSSTEDWVFRSSVVQGTQQVWVAALWYWGYRLNDESLGYVSPWWVVLVVWPVGVGCLGVGAGLFWGLPEYYRQTPPRVSNFLTTLFRRKLVIWFLISEILRDYWLSGPYGLNWTYLWNMNVPKLHILFLIIAFFIGLWALVLAFLTHLSKTHTWLLPIFAVGLGAPRWCQMLWSTSSIGTYLPWAGPSGPYLGITLWLWLGILDSIQGIGLGMILLQTLSRLHVLTTLAFSQIIGAVVVMIARATSPDGLGPGFGSGAVFPNFGLWEPGGGGGGGIGIGEGVFWVALGCQMVIVVGYFWFYRKEELARP
ncbi:glycoside hydrolase family 13 and glycosyltransferase family 5 protein [Lentinula aff. detonsa]|uniref:alpha-1,3-glucan synthase n=1 Tax=Lentinula aff. detonsa TaxID=2804958 RepID=A0AA38NBN1_9AGAR|nr:glycoside hydrolase family 13 and glycosyltransferase family 5 protein [Lentinula aff. detonsa]